MSFIISRKACTPLFPLAVPSICTSLFEKINTRTYTHAHAHTHTGHNVFIIISGNFGVTPDSQPLLPSEQFIWSTAGSESDSTALGTTAAVAATVRYLIVSWREKKEGQRDRGKEVRTQGRKRQGREGALLWSNLFTLKQSGRFCWGRADLRLVCKMYFLIRSYVIWPGEKGDNQNSVLGRLTLS